MNPWIIDFCYLVLFACLVIIGITSVVLIIVRKHKKKGTKPMAISLTISILLLLVLMVFMTSHSTYYKYNDWTVLQSNVNMLQQRYGAFDLGTISENQAGRVAYYIYTDNKSNLKHYYCMEYDEWGVVYKVYVLNENGG